LAIDADLLTGEAIDEGSLVIQASVSDANGNTRLVDINAVLDITAPTLTVNNLVDGALSGVISTTLSPILSGSTDQNNASITLNVDVLGTLTEVTTFQADSSGNFSINLTAALFENIVGLDDGDISLQLVVEDDAENQATQDIGVSLNIIPPTLEVTSIEIIDLVVVKSTTISGTTDAEAGTELNVSVELLDAPTLDLGTALVQADGTWTITELSVLNLANVTISMEDGDGNLVTLTVDSEGNEIAARPAVAARGFVSDELLSDDGGIEINLNDSEGLESTELLAETLSIADLLSEPSTELPESLGTESSTFAQSTQPSQDPISSLSLENEIMKQIQDTSKLDI
ncbi:hypothetical protein N7931_19220, partial [Catenovulum sp. 2E275]|uniref:hypothetical protein n=1 Tax=Catenovulum sp. 2E275 TaxID=2980497 RepID=UPI0021CEE3E5